jgi:hypothetical protein
MFGNVGFAPTNEQGVLFVFGAVAHRQVKRMAVSTFGFGIAEWGSKITVAYYD